MRVVVSLDVSQADRYVIGHYFATEPSARRTYATRVQTRQFIRGAVRSALTMRAEMLFGRARATYKRLSAETPSGEPGLVPPAEDQRELPW